MQCVFVLNNGTKYKFKLIFNIFLSFWMYLKIFFLTISENFKLISQNDCNFFKHFFEQEIETLFLIFKKKNYYKTVDVKWKFFFEVASRDETEIKLVIPNFSVQFRSFYFPMKDLMKQRFQYIIKILKIFNVNFILSSINAKK